MTPIELMSDCVARNCDILKMTLSDFSEQEMFVRPAPGANHAAWQLAHLTGAAAHMVNSVAPGVIPDAAVRMNEKYTGQTSNNDDPEFYPSKADLLDTFAQAHDALVQWARTLSEADLARPTPGRMADFAPTVGHLVLMTIGHVMMHVGQFQVIRRKLGKPLLF
jgi:hypothetical protein